MSFKSSALQLFFEKGLAERQSITPEMALRIGKFCGNGPGFWLRLQMRHDLWNAEREMADEIARIPTLKVA